MAFWIFKVSDQQLYADVEGVRYEYDNRHSVRVRPGDGFVYLDKRASAYRFTGAGSVLRVDERPPTETERRRGRAVRTVYTAVLSDVTWSSLLWISRQTLLRVGATGNRSGYRPTSMRRDGVGQSQYRRSPPSSSARSSPQDLTCIIRGVHGFFRLITPRRRWKGSQNLQRPVGHCLKGCYFALSVRGVSCPPRRVGRCSVSAVPAKQSICPGAHRTRHQLD